MLLTFEVLRQHIATMLTEDVSKSLQAITLIFSSQWASAMVSTRHVSEWAYDHALRRYISVMLFSLEMLWQHWATMRTDNISNSLQAITLIFSSQWASVMVSTRHVSESEYDHVLRRYICAMLFSLEMLWQHWATVRTNNISKLLQAITLIFSSQWASAMVSTRHLSESKCDHVLRRYISVMLFSLEMLWQHWATVRTDNISK